MNENAIRSDRPLRGIEKAVAEMATAQQKSALTFQVGGAHYKNFPIQPIQFCHANKIPYIESCIIKYACRWREKDGLRDLEKIKHYVDLLIELEGLRNE